MTDDYLEELTAEHDEALRQLDAQRALTRSHRFGVGPRQGPADIVPLGPGGDGRVVTLQYLSLQSQPQRWTPPLLDVSHGGWEPHDELEGFTARGNGNSVVYVRTVEVLERVLRALEAGAPPPRAVLIPRNVEAKLDDPQDVYDRGLRLATRVVLVEEAEEPDPARWLR